MASKILESTDPKIQKELGRRVRNFDPSVWSDHCDDIVKLANYIKVCVCTYVTLSHLTSNTQTVVHNWCTTASSWNVGMVEYWNDGLAADTKNLFPFYVNGIKQSLWISMMHVAGSGPTCSYWSVLWDFSSTECSSIIVCTCNNSNKLQLYNNTLTS